MISKKFLYASSSLLISGSILLAGGTIGSIIYKSLYTYSFNYADIVIIFGILFMISGFIFLILSFIKHD